MRSATMFIDTDMTTRRENIIRCVKRVEFASDIMLT